MTEINYNTIDPASTDTSIFDVSIYFDATLYVPFEGLKNAHTTSLWMYFKNIKEKDFSRIDQLCEEFDPNAPFEIYSLGGIRVNHDLDTLPIGIYILRQGNTISKIHIKQ